MHLDRNEFQQLLEQSIEMYPDRFTDKERDYVRDKGIKIFNLLEELDSKGLLVKLTDDDIRKIRLVYSNVMKNIDEIRNLYLTVTRILKKGVGLKGETVIKLKDRFENEYSLSAKQMVIIIGITYSYLCEVLKTWLSKIILFKKSPTGLGDLKNKLRENDIKHLDFFDDLNHNVRNSFFHLDFRIEGNGDIFYSDNSGNRCIKLIDLFWLFIFADRSSYIAMFACEYIFHNYS